MAHIDTRELSPPVKGAFLGSDVIVAVCETMFVEKSATRKAREKGAQKLDDLWEKAELCRLFHFSISLNPQVGISGNMIEGERMLAVVDFSLGHQNTSYDGAVGSSPHHEDVMLATPAVFLNGKQMSGGGRLNPELGFEEM